MVTFLQYDPQLVLMDILLPNYNGFYWTGEIRKLSKVPIIFLSSASDNMNIVMAVNMGADDFVPKPFDMDVLLAKIQAVPARYDYAGTAALVECRGAMLNKSDELFLSGGADRADEELNFVSETLIREQRQCRKPRLADDQAPGG